MTPFPPPPSSILTGISFLLSPFVLSCNCFPSSPFENPVINQSLLILPPLLYWRESIFYSPYFVLFCRKLPPSSPPENHVIHQNLPTSFPKAISYVSCLIDGNQFSIVPTLYSFAQNCPPSLPENHVIHQNPPTPLPQGDKLWQLPYP